MMSEEKVSDIYLIRPLDETAPLSDAFEDYL